MGGGGRGGGREGRGGASSAAEGRACGRRREWRPRRLAHLLFCKRLRKRGKGLRPRRLRPGRRGAERAIRVAVYVDAARGAANRGAAGRQGPPPPPPPRSRTTSGSSTAVRYLVPEFRRLPTELALMCTASAHEQYTVHLPACLRQSAGVAGGITCSTPRSVWVVRKVQEERSSTSPARRARA